MPPRKEKTEEAEAEMKNSFGSIDSISYHIIFIGTFVVPEIKSFLLMYINDPPFHYLSPSLSLSLFPLFFFFIIW